MIFASTYTFFIRLGLIVSEMTRIESGEQGMSIQWSVAAYSILCNETFPQYVAFFYKFVVQKCSRRKHAL